MSKFQKLIGVAICIAFALTVSVKKCRAGDLQGKIIAIVTHPVGSLGYTMGSILANAITKHSSLRVDVEPTPGPKSWLPRMERGEVQLGLASDLDVYAALTGDKEFYESPYKNIRLIKQAYHALRMTMLVRANSDIKSMSDLVGKRVAALTPGQPSLLRTSEASIYSAGVDLEKIKWTVAGHCCPRTNKVNSRG